MFGVLGSDQSFSANRRIGATGGHPASSNRVAGSGEIVLADVEASPYPPAPPLEVLPVV